MNTAAIDAREPRPDSDASWSFSRLGPFHALQRRLGLLSDRNLAAPRRALLFAALAWLPLLALAMLQGLALNAQHERALLYDFSAHALAVAIAAFVLMEQSSERRMALLVGKFAAHELVGASARADFVRVRQAMERRTASWPAELVVAVAAYVLALVWVTAMAARVDGGTWVGRLDAGMLQPTLAGWWMLLVTLPLFLFLLGRWLWRFFTWGRLLRDISRCELQLVATHPDRCGGLAFIGQYPNTYMLFVFALSTVVSASVLKQVVYAGADLLGFKYALLGVIVFLAVAFVLPLLAFTPVLIALKRRGLTRYGALISRHHQAFERKWCDGAPDEELLGSPDASSLADLSASYEAIKSIKPLPLSKESLLPLLVAAVLPMAAVAATQAPVKQVLGALKGLLLL